MSGIKGKSGIYKRTDISKKNMSDSHKGQKTWNKGLKMIDINPNYKNAKGMAGKKQSLHTRKLISNSHKGKKSYLWKGGISKDINKYTRERYKNLSIEEKKKVSWEKNKRNRVIKRLKIESLNHTYGEWELLKKQYNYTCPCCRKQEPEIKLTEDHIIPVSKGGSDLIENIQPLCLRCNIIKHTKIIKY